MVDGVGGVGGGPVEPIPDYGDYKSIMDLIKGGGSIEYSIGEFMDDFISHPTDTGMSPIENGDAAGLLYGDLKGLAPLLNHYMQNMQKTHNHPDSKIMGFVKLLKGADLIKKNSQGQYVVNPLLDKASEKGYLTAGFGQILVGNGQQDHTLVYYSEGNMNLTDYGKEWKQDWDNYWKP